MESKEIDSKPWGAEPRSGLFLVILALAWILPGLFGHEPWKPDEGYTIGLIQHIFDTGDWVVPTLTGEPFMEKPPLFFITAAFFAKLFSPWLLPLHQASGMAVVLYISLMFLFVYLAGKEMGGPNTGGTAVLCLIGCIGLLVRAHSVITDTALWCGFAMANYGLLLAKRKGGSGAFWLGAGVGMAFMSKGFLGPAIIALAALLLPVFCPDRRNRAYIKTLLWSLVFFSPWFVIWPAALYTRSPELFDVWFWGNNIGRFLGPRFGYAKLGGAPDKLHYLKIFFYFTLPLWPAALSAWLKDWRGALRYAPVALQTLLVAVGMILLSLAAGARDLYLIILLPSLALLAAKGEHTLPGWAARRLADIPLIAFSVVLFACWALWLAWLSGVSPHINAKLAEYATDLDAFTGPIAVVLALAYTVGWFWMMRPRKGFRSDWVFVWAVGITAFWGTFMLLFMPILDHAKGYRSTFAAMAVHLPEDKNSVVLESYRLGESERAILDYYTGWRTNRIDAAGKLVDPVYPTAPYLLSKQGAGNRKPQSFETDGAWTPIWTGGRPGKTKDLFILYKNNIQESK